MYIIRIYTDSLWRNADHRPSVRGSEIVVSDKILPSKGYGRYARLLADTEKLDGIWLRSQKNPGGAKSHETSQRYAPRIRRDGMDVPVIRTDGGAGGEAAMWG